MYPAVFSVALETDQVIDMLDVFSVRQRETAIVPDQICNRLSVYIGRIFQVVDLC